MTQTATAEAIGTDAGILNFKQDFTMQPANNIDRKATRYIFFPGDVMSDRHKRSSPIFRVGGECYGADYPWLALSSYVLQRCRITPLNMSIRNAPAHEQITNPQEIEPYNGEISVQASGVTHIKAYPDDGIKTIIGAENNINGKVELTKLKGLAFVDDPVLNTNNAKNRAYIAELQQLFFPFWPNVLRGEVQMPATLREIEGFIHAAKDASADTLIIETAEEMLVACEQFRFWGTEMLERDATLIRAGRLPAGYVHTYSPVADVLLRQLELPRESFTGQTQVVVPAQNNNTEVVGTLKTIAENQMLLGQMLMNNQPAISEKMATKAEAVEAKAGKGSKAAKAQNEEPKPETAAAEPVTENAEEPTATE